jgi:cell division protein FtsQ
MRRLMGANKNAPGGAARQSEIRRARHPFRLRGRRGPLLICGATLAAVAAFAGGLFELHRSGRLEPVVEWAADHALAFSAQVGLVVSDIEVEGRAMTERDAILRAVGATRGTPLLAVNPAQAKAQLEALPWVRSAAVERRLPDTLYIRLAERQPLALWQRQGKLVLIDRDGVVITGERLDRFPGLIVVVGDDAPRRAAALLDMLASQPDIAGRVVAAVLVGGRRWNLQLDNAVTVQLPEDKPEAAWARLAELEHGSRLLARDVQIVDMRLPDRLVVRVTPEPPKEPVKKGRTTAKST